MRYEHALAVAEDGKVYGWGNGCSLRRSGVEHDWPTIALFKAGLTVQQFPLPTVMSWSDAAEEPRVEPLLAAF